MPPATGVSPLAPTGEGRGVMTCETGGDRPDRVGMGNADEKKSEDFFFHVSSTKLCLTFEFSPRLTSIKSCQITLKGLELPRETSDCNQTVSLHCSRHSERVGGERGERAREGEPAGGLVKLGLETPPHNADGHLNELGRYEKAKHSSNKGQRVIILANVYGRGLLWALRWAPDSLELHDSQALLSFSLWT